jgi:hypothetical protein
MTKVKIRYINPDVTTSIETKRSFVDFVIELFKKKVYISIPKGDSPILAINTDNIISVEEDKTEG